MDCTICRGAQRDWKEGVRCDGIESVEECPTGQVPKLMEENLSFIEFFDRAMAGLFDGFGALKIETVQTLCDILGVPGGERPVILDKTLVCVKAIREIMKTEKQSGHR